jgi:hypothetical protein
MPRPKKDSSKKNVITADIDTTRPPNGRRPKKVIVDDSKVLFTKKYIINDKHTEEVLEEVAIENGMNSKAVEWAYLSVFSYLKELMEDTYKTDIPHCLLVNKFGKFYSSDKQITSYRKKKGYGRL